MFEALKIFFAGICGVFLGMAFLYIAMKVTSGAIEKLAERASKE